MPPIFFDQRGDAAKRSEEIGAESAEVFSRRKNRGRGKFSALRGSIKAFFASCEKRFHFLPRPVRTPKAPLSFSTLRGLCVLPPIPK